MTVKQRRRWPRIVAGTMSGVVLLGVGAAGVAGAYYNQLSGQIASQEVAPELGHELRLPKPGDPINILLMGSDSREHGNGHGSTSTIAGARSDTTILLHLSGDRTWAMGVSIPRDSMVLLPSCKQPDGTMSEAHTARFNEAFFLGGAGCTIKTVEQLTGVQINHFVVVDFKGFAKVVDAIGGVEVCMKAPVNDSLSQLKLPKGKSVVKGEQALAFVRARKTLGDGSDIGRIDRQQAFLGSAIRKATSLGVVANPSMLYSMLSETTKALTTDKALASLDAFTELAINSSGIKPNDIAFVTVPVVDNSDHATVSWDARPAAALWRSIDSDQPWREHDADTGVPTGTITVDIVNGSGTSGIGGNVADGLKAAGFKIGTITAGNYSTATQIQYGSGQEAAAQTLKAKVGDAKLTVASKSNGHVTLIIGSSYAGPGSPNNDPSQMAPPKTAAEQVCN